MILILSTLAGAQEALDEDADGLSAAEERYFRTDPFDEDTDSDGLLDGIEASVGLDPMRPDTDGDGRPDGLEIMQGTNPAVVDTPVSPVPLKTQVVAAEPIPEPASVIITIQPSVSVGTRQRTAQQGSALPIAALLLLSLVPVRLSLVIRERSSEILRSLYGMLGRSGTPRS